MRQKLEGEGLGSQDFPDVFILVINEFNGISQNRPARWRRWPETCFAFGGRGCFLPMGLAGLIILGKSSALCG
jgi:hypothetical protein